MSLYHPKEEKDIKYPKYVPNNLETELRAVKRYADCDKKRYTVSNQYIKHPKPL